MRQYSLTNLPSQDRFVQWVKDNLKALCDASQIDVIPNVHASGAALSSLDNAVANDIPIWTDATDVTFLNLSAYFVSTLAALNSAGAWATALGVAPAGSYLVTTNNLSDVANVPASRTNLGLGSAATHPDSDFLLAGNNLSDIPNKATARTNLGVAIASIEFVIDGGGAPIPTGLKGYLEIPFACTIVQATLLADQSGSIVTDIWATTYANFNPGTHPVAGDTICGGNPPTISSAVKSQDATLTGWTTAIPAGTIFAFNVNSAATITRVTLSLKVLRA